jgi:hypothetical protein
MAQYGFVPAGGNAADRLQDLRAPEGNRCARCVTMPLEDHGGGGGDDDDDEALR